MEQHLVLIGKVHSPLKRLEDCPLQEAENAPEAIIEVFEPFVPAIADLQVGAEIILFTWLHQANRQTLVTKPRNNPTAKDTGVFSTRSPETTLRP